MFAPHAVAVYTSAPEGSPRNVFEVTVRELEARGSVVLVTGAVGATTVAAEITAGSAADLDLVPGARVHFVVKATEVAVHARK
ncbi:TOBE domain-containing protein [Rhodococcus triatomae]|uniref:TOBE domain-containing protein n=1 Tax=Rhodococcus triatomae TaxID=300028 RepID=UPI003F5CFD8B